MAGYVTHGGTLGSGTMDDCDERAYMRPRAGEVRSIGSDIKIAALNVGKKINKSLSKSNPGEIVDDLRPEFGAHNLSDLVV